MKDIKVVILTANLGKGHNIIANNLQFEIEKQLNINTFVIDYFKLYNLYIDKIASKWYRMVLQNFPLIYKIEYSLFIDKSGIPKNKTNMLAISNLKKIIGEDLSNVILISVFPNATLGTAKIKCKRKYTIVTDYGIHRRWISKNIDGYFVANKQIKDILIKNNINKNKIHITGIPVAKKFYKKLNKTYLKKKFGIKNANKTILIMGGGDGVMKDPIQIIKALANKYNILFVAGTNKRLKSRIDNLKISNCFTFGFTDKIKELIDVSDLVISKAGGISITEFAVSHLPIIIYKINPGQEYDNIKYFLSNNACLVIKNVNELKKSVDDIIRKKMNLNMNLIDTKTPAIDKIIQYLKKDI